MSLLDFFNDRTGAREVAHGTDGRINVSARSDSRAYYNSRDKKKTYSLAFDDSVCSAGDFNVALFNDDVSDKLVVRSIGVNALNLAGFKLHQVTGTAAGGAVAATPVNLHLGEADAVVTASTVANSDSSPISGLTSSVVIDHLSVVASGHEEFRLGDTLRLAKGQGIAVEMDSGANATRVFGVIFFYFEPD